MAMARPVLVSEKGLEGIAATDGDQVLLAESPDDYGRLISVLMQGDYPLLGERARQCVLSGFSWQENLPEVVLLLGGESRVPRYARGYVDI